MPALSHQPVLAGSAVPAAKRPLELGHRASLVVAALVVAHTLWTSAAPAIAYRLYGVQWHLVPVQTATLFAIYPMTVVAVLAAARKAQDRLGDRHFMRLGLTASLIGSVVFALAPDINWLYGARALMGVGVGLSAGPSTAAVARRASPRLAAVITTVAQAGGFSAGLLLGGGLAAYAPWPTRLSFWVLAACVALLLIAAWFLPETERRAHTDVATDQAPASAAKGSRWSITVAALAVVTAYNHGVLVLSFGGQVAHDLIGSSNALVNGAVLALFPISLGLVSLTMRRPPARTAIALGAIASALGMGLLAAATVRHDLALFLLATAVAGAGYSLLFVGALSVVNATVQPSRRTGVISTLYLLAYLSMGVFAIGLGMVATAHGLAFAIDLGAGIIGAASLVTLLAVMVRA